MTQNIRPAVLTAVALLVTTLGQASAGQYFERNGTAIDGYDPVAYFTDRKPVKGLPEFISEYKGSTFYFTSAAHREAFVSDPEKFAPQYGGYCAYGMAKGYKAAIDPAAFTVAGDKLYLNYSETVRAQWLSDIPGYVLKADMNWPDIKTSTKVHE